MATLKLTQKVLDKFYYYREFLKKSKKYRRINELLIDRSKRYPITNPLVHSWCYAKEELNTPYYDWLSCATSAKEREALYQEDKSNKTILNVVYPLFQDVNNDEQFDMFGHRVKLFYELHQLSPVSNATLELLGIIQSTFKKHDDQKLFTKTDILNELFERIVDMDFHNELDHLIEIDPLLPDPYLVEQFKRHLRTIKNRDNLKTINNNDIALEIWGFNNRDKDIALGIQTMFISSHGHRGSLLDDLLKLLARLETKGASEDNKTQKKLLEEIYLEDNPNLTKIPCNDSNWSLLRRHKNLAFELIEKAENALFPGPCTAPKKMKGAITTNKQNKIDHLLKINHKKPFSDNNFDPPIIADCWPFCA